MKHSFRQIRMLVGCWVARVVRLRPPEVRTSWVLNPLRLRVQACRVVPTQTCSSRLYAPRGRFNKRRIAGARKDPQVRRPPPSYFRRSETQNLRFGLAQGGGWAARSPGNWAVRGYRRQLRLVTKVMVSLMRDSPARRAAPLSLTREWQGRPTARRPTSRETTVPFPRGKLGTWHLR